MTTNTVSLSEIKNRILKGQTDIWAFERPPAVSLCLLTEEPNFPSEEGRIALLELLDLEGQVFEKRALELLTHFKERLKTIRADLAFTRNRYNADKAFTEMKQQKSLHDQWLQLSNGELDRLWKHREKMAPKEAEILRMLIRQRKGIK